MSIATIWCALIILNIILYNCQKDKAPSILTLIIVIVFLPFILLPALSIDRINTILRDGAEEAR